MLPHTRRSQMPQVATMLPHTQRSQAQVTQRLARVGKAAAFPGAPEPFPPQLPVMGPADFMSQYVAAGCPGFLAPCPQPAMPMPMAPPPMFYDDDGARRNIPTQPFITTPQWSVPNMAAPPNMMMMGPPTMTAPTPPPPVPPDHRPPPEAAAPPTAPSMSRRSDQPFTPPFKAAAASNRRHEYRPAGPARQRRYHLRVAEKALSQANMAAAKAAAQQQQHDQMLMQLQSEQRKQLQAQQEHFIKAQEAMMSRAQEMADRSLQQHLAMWQRCTARAVRAAAAEAEAGPQAAAAAAAAAAAGPPIKSEAEAGTLA